MQSQRAAAPGNYPQLLKAVELPNVDYDQPQMHALDMHLPWKLCARNVRHSLLNKFASFARVLTALAMLAPTIALGGEESHGHAQHTKPDIQVFAFDDDQLIAWSVQTSLTQYVTPENTLAESQNNTLAIHLVPSKARELTEITRSIADPVSTTDNLEIFYRDVSVSRLRISYPLPEVDMFHLRVSDSRLKQLTDALPEEKRVEGFE